MRCHLVLDGAGAGARAALQQTSLELGRQARGVEGGVVEAEVGGAFPRRPGLLRRVLRGLPALVHGGGHGGQPVEAHVDLLQQ